jgi:hypothetical protein
MITKINMEIVVINYSIKGVTESEYEKMCDEVAPAFAAVPGLVSKAWLADKTNGIFGGVHTFENGAAVAAFMGSELFAPVGAMPSLVDVSVRRFGVLSAPTAVTRGLVNR